MSNQKIVTEAALSALASDIKTALSGKANSNDVYTKTEIDNALELKADKSELYNVYPTEQESGAIAHFTDGADNIPVKSLTSQITAVESGSGEKSPENPYTISGFDSGVVSVCGVNFFDGILEKGYISTTTGEDTTNTSGNQWRCKNYIRVKPNTSLYMKLPNGYTTNNSNITAYYYDVNKNFIGYESNKGNTVIQIPSNCHWFRFCNYIVTAIQDAPIGNTLNYPSTDTDYEAYNGNTYTFAFGQTVYGGHFDNKGNLVITKAIVDLGSLSWAYHAPSGNVGAYFDTLLPDDSITGNRDVAFDGISEIYNIIPSKDIALSGYDNNVCALANATRRFITCDTRYTDATSYKNAMNGIMLVYPLATPITLSITSQDIPTLLGENNIFSNCGDVEVDYHADIGLYIDKKISSLAQA